MDQSVRFDDLDVGRAAMVYTETHIPCFRRVVACADADMRFIELRNAFAGWCDFNPVRSNTPHTYGVTSFGLDSSALRESFAREFD